MEFYSTPEAVMRYTGIRHSDLGLEDEEQLKAILRDLLREAKDLIDQDRNRDYHEEILDGKRDAVPPGINNIALRMVANMMAQAVMRRDTPIVRVDDFSFQMVDDQVFTNAIKKDLSKYPYKPNLGMIRVGSRRDEED